MTMPYQPEAGMEWSSQGLNPTHAYCDQCGYYHVPPCDGWGTEDEED